MTIYFCCDETRRNAVRAHATLNGIDFVEVQDDPSLPMADRQRFLLLTLLKAPASPLTRDNVRIEGGEAVRGIRVLNVNATADPLTLEIEVDEAGDFSTYTLRLVATATSDDPPAGYDRLLSVIDFSFKVNCDTDFDCEDTGDCPPKVFTEPVLDYLARDFNSLRQAMLDRMRILVPDWREDHVADLMHALVDLKAQIADYQHYQLDAINTEAYLFTARSRISVRRHARLVDYRMHDGVSARIWVHFQVDPAVTAGVPLPAHTQVFTTVPGKPVTFEADTQTYREALEYGPQVFETMHDATLYSAHNFMCFYTWGDEDCVLPRGATKASLQGHFPDLHPGDVLIFEEVRGARTGDPADEDPSRRFAVRLVAVSLTEDELTGTPVTDIRWHAEDALPAPLCLSADVAAPPPDWNAECGDAISVARGNIVLADHGRTLPPEDLGTVPASTLAYVTDRAHCDDASGAEDDSVPPRFRPYLQQGPVSQVVAYDHAVSASPTAPRSVASVMRFSPWAALPAIRLAHDQSFSGALWEPQRDLLNSTPDKEEFVLEVDNDGSAYIRFGDDENGKRPNPGESFWARYRLGDFSVGNIGADALAHVITNETAIIAVRNPLPSIGGTLPEEIETVRQNAPQAFRTQERAVTPADYEARALRFPGVQRAAATIRWTGCWYTVFLTVDRFGGLAVTQEFEDEFRAYMDGYRLMGYDLEIDGPQYVPLEIEMEVCVEPDYFRSAVREALLRVFSTRTLPDGTRGVFHPDNFTFGQPVYLSRLYAAASAVPGVQSVEVTTFQVQDQPGTSGLASGSLEFGRLQIAQLENDPNFPKRGVFRLSMKGGK
jgi:hypothetical protein